MPGIVVVYYSGFGHTEKIAEAVADAAGAALLRIDGDGDVPAGGWEQLDSADALIFGSPTYMGAPSWQFKRFAEASSARWAADAWRDKVAAGFTNSATLNGDKFLTLMYMFTLSQQHNMFWVGSGMHAANTKASTRADINNLGGYAGLLTATPADASVDEMVPGDLATAREFGRRLALATAKIAAAGAV